MDLLTPFPPGAPLGPSDLYLFYFAGISGVCPDTRIGCHKTGGDGDSDAAGRTGLGQKVCHIEDECEGIFYYLWILYRSGNPQHVQRMDEQAENIESVKRAIRRNPVLTSEERSILSITYKNAVSSRRSAIKNVATLIEQKGGRTRFPNRLARLQEFETRLQDELTDICLDLVRLIDDSLEPASFQAEERVFYEKMKADYYRYICETNKESPHFAHYSGRAKECYETALDVAQSELPPASPSYLGLVLNFTVFLYEVMQLQNEAIELSEKTYADTQDLVDQVDDAVYGDTSEILHLLRDNFVGWKRFRDQQVG
jgi:14-3-3 protein epsilon